MISCVGAAAVPTIKVGAQAGEAAFGVGAGVGAVGAVVGIMGDAGLVTAEFVGGAVGKNIAAALVAVVGVALADETAGVFGAGGSAG